MNKSKTGSSRRKGDEFQDLTALQLVLEAYISNQSFEAFIEYEKAGSFDDVVVVLPDRVDCYQAKHAVSQVAVYVVDDLINKDSVIFIEKFAKSWKKLIAEFPGHQLGLHLRSNRALDAQLAEVVTDEGFFDDQFRENRYRKNKRKLRNALLQATGLTEDEFRQFLCSFHFDLKQPSWRRLEKHIQAELLDHKLGVSDRRVFADLKRLIESHSIETADPITPQIVDTYLRATQTRYLLPQSFSIDKERFVKPSTFEEQLNDQLGTADGEYVVITGPPGSGKSTALTEYCDVIQEKFSDRFIVVRYYCFVRVHDNRQRMRVEADSLRVNLLTELQRRFPNVLDDRRFDFSEDRFYEVLEAVGSHCQQQHKKLVVLLDGLDHVERDDEVRASVIAALPAKLPQGLVFLIGTQELNRWSPIALKKGREKRHVNMPLFSWDEIRAYIVKRCKIVVADETLRQISEKSAGLPLYLRYLAELLSSSKDPVTAIDTIPGTVGGDVHSYYETLWAAFEVEGRSDAKYLSSVLAGLRFSVHEGELMAFQTGIPDTPRYEAAYRRVRHLLRADNSLVSIFHNSFRVFVSKQTNPITRREISEGILSRLKLEELESARWFKHACWYALEAGEFDYLLARVNRDFVDAALIRFRSEKEITDGIECAIEAAAATSDLVALSRLGSLKYRTNERLEHEFPWSVLTDILLYTGRIDQAVESIYSNESKTVIAEEAYSLRVMLKLVDIGMNDLAEELFRVFKNNFRVRNELGLQGIIILAQCLAVFKARPTRVMRWLSGITLQRDTLDPEELSIEYAPHLAAYLDGLVRSGQDRLWNRLKKLNSPFSTLLMRQLTIRAVANWKTNGELQTEVEEYIEKHINDTNIEVAFYAAKVGLPAADVNRLAGQFEFPPEMATRGAGRTEFLSQALRFAYWSVILGYEQNDVIIRELRFRLRKLEAVWVCTQAHLLKVGEALGHHFANREIDWFSYASEAIEALEAARDAEGEYTWIALDAARSILDKSLRWLGEVISERCQERVGDWAVLLKRLRSSFIWTCHYGFGESITNYSFEFPIWEKQAELPGVRSHLRSTFLDCAKSYDGALSLKGGMRGEHFLTLAALAARCGFRSDSSLWFKRGIEASLAYGYRKDVTLECLTDVLTLLGKYYPDKVLANAAAILEMNRWMPSATDGRSTKHFAQHLLPTIIEHNRAAALEVLRTYYKELATWQADESVTKYIRARKSGDPEFLWALCGLLDPNESLESRQHVVDLTMHSSPGASDSWSHRLSNYITTMINPRYWPHDLWEKAVHIHDRPLRQQRGEGSNLDDLDDKEYTLEGQSVTLDILKQRCSTSFKEMVATIEKLEKENDYVPDYRLSPVLTDHIDNATNIDELRPIKSYFEEHGKWRESEYWEQIGHRFLNLGDTSTGLECLERAIQKNLKSNALATLIEYDCERARDFVMQALSKRLQSSSYSGFYAPDVAANLCDLLGKEDDLKGVFDDYLHHCLELFSQWPKDRVFDELRDWSDADRDEDIQITHLLIDRLDANACEFGDRLVCSICTLAESRGEKVFPVLAERLASASGLQLCRLLQVFARLSHSNPTLFQKHCHCLAPQLSQGDSFLVLIASKAIQRAYSEGESIPNDLSQAINDVDRRYSSTISYRSSGILKTMPSDNFVELFKRGTQFSFQRQFIAVCEILDLDLDSLFGHLERKLLDKGTTLEEEKELAISMSRAFSHPQGWPVTWFFSDLNTKMSNLFYQTIDDLLLNQRYQPQHLEAIWRVIQPNDPEYSYTQLSPMPDEVRPLLVESKADWMVTDHEETVVTIAAPVTTEWISVFEYKELAQEGPYHREFISQTHVQSALLIPEIADHIAFFSEQSWGEKVGTHHPSENLTWQQFRRALLDGHLLEPQSDQPCLPFVSYSQRKPGFLGFHTIASLASKIIRDQELLLDGMSVFAGEEQVACYEAWQEGYPSEEYHDEPLSFGARLRVSKKFVNQVCDKLGRAFAIQTIENRFVMKSYQKDPEESCSITSIQLWPTGL